MRRWVGVALVVALAGAARAQTTLPGEVRWSGVGVNGEQVAVPGKGEVSVLAFVRPGQIQSDEAVKQIRRALAEREGVQVTLVVSEARLAKEAAGGQKGWAVVADAQFELAGKCGVHVWPTTVVVREDGRVAAHVAGMPAAYAFQLGAYLGYAAGELNEQDLKERLTQWEIVADSDRQKAARHLTVAQRLLSDDQTEAAAAEVAAGLKLEAENAGLRLMHARVLLAQGDSSGAVEEAEALAATEEVGAGRAELRARGLIEMGRWEQAAGALAEAVKLGLDPVEAGYLTGLVRQHGGDARGAAEAFRAAVEALPAGGAMKLAGPATTKP